MLLSVTNLYISLGLVVTKVHRVIQFVHSKWLAGYIELIRKCREESKNKLDKNFYKLMINSAYGKMCENTRNRVDAYLVRTEDELPEKISRFYQVIQIFTENLAVVTLRKAQFTRSQPYWSKYLDLSKLFMYNFHSNVMKKHLNVEVLYSDTDSLTYKIFTKDLHKELTEKEEMKSISDSSNYLQTSPL